VFKWIVRQSLMTSSVWSRDSINVGVCTRKPGALLGVREFRNAEGAVYGGRKQTKPIWS